MMIKRIYKNDKIFNSDRFKKDEYLFSKILNNDFIDMCSDGNNYILFYDEYNKQIYIWTNDKINDEVLDEIEIVISCFLNGETKCNISCKEKLYKILFDKSFISFNLDDYKETYFLRCNNLIKPNKCDGNIYIPNEFDSDKIAKFYYDKCLDENSRKFILFDQIKNYIYNIIVNEDNNTVFAWKNDKGQIVALAFNYENANYSVINAYMNIDNYEYSSNLVYELSTNIIEENMKPVLISDKNYLGFYKDLGYDKCDTLVSSGCSINKFKIK